MTPAPVFTAADIQCAEAVNSAIAQGNKSNDQSKAIAFLRALNVSIADSATGDDVLNAIRPIGRKAGDDSALRAQYCVAALLLGPGETAVLERHEEPGSVILSTHETDA